MVELHVPMNQWPTDLLNIHHHHPDGRNCDEFQRLADRIATLEHQVQRMSESRHVLTCNARHGEPVGCEGCSCPDRRLDRVRAARDALAAREAEWRMFVESHQWTGTRDHGNYDYAACEECGRIADTYASCDFRDGPMPEQGHTPECPIGRLLATPASNIVAEVAAAVALANAYHRREQHHTSITSADVGEAYWTWLVARNRTLSTEKGTP